MLRCTSGRGTKHRKLCKARAGTLCSPSLLSCPCPRLRRLCSFQSCLYAPSTARENPDKLTSFKTVNAETMRSDTGRSTDQGLRVCKPVYVTMIVVSDRVCPLFRAPAGTHSLSRPRAAKALPLNIARRDMAWSWHAILMVGAVYVGPESAIPGG